MAGYQEARGYFLKYKPALIRTFDEYYELIWRHFSPKTETQWITDTAKKLALASVGVYIPPAVVQLSIRRNELHSFSELVSVLSANSSKCSRMFVQMYPSLQHDIGNLPTELSAGPGKHIYRLANAHEILRFVLSKSNGEQQILYIRLFGSMAASSPDAVQDFLSLHETLRQHHPWSTLQTWLKRGVDLIAMGRIDDAVRHLLVLSRESRETLGESHAVLEDVKGVLTIYGSCIAGRTLGIQPGDLSTFAIPVPYSDGKTVYLPGRQELFGTIEKNERVYSALVALQAAQINNGSFEFTPSKNELVPDLRARYGTVLPDEMEQVRKLYGNAAQTIRERATGEIEVEYPGGRVLQVLQTPHEEFFYLFPTPDLARQIFSLLETSRIEAILCQKYPGLRQDFQEINRGILAKMPKEQISPEDLGGRFVYCIDKLVRCSLDQNWKSEYLSGRLGEMREMVLKVFEQTRAGGATVQTSARACFDVYALFYDIFPVVVWCRQNDIRNLFFPYLKSSIQPEIVADVSPELVTFMKVRPEPLMLEDEEEREIDLTSLSKSERKAESLREAILSGRIRVYRYPEFSLKKGTYRHKYCTLYESVLEKSDNSIYGDTIRRYEQTYRRLKKRFLMMQPEELEISRRWLDGTDIHIGDAVDYATDVLRGSSPDEKIYTHKKRNIRDIVAAILVDASSSTEEMVNGMRIIDIEKAALCLLAAVLEPIGDIFGIFSFFSMGRSNVFYQVTKDFHESWNETTQSRLGSIDAAASNRDGCAVRHAAERLLSRPEKTKLLLLLSDGIPADSGYGTQDASQTSDYAIEDTRRAIIEARTRGVISYCITIDRSARSYISHLYGDYHYTILSDVSLLPEKLAKLYLRLTR